MIAIEFVSETIRRFYRNEPPFDNGDRDERRAATRLRPHSQHVGLISIKRPRDAQTSEAMTHGGTP